MARKRNRCSRMIMMHIVTLRGCRRGTLLDGEDGEDCGVSRVAGLNVRRWEFLTSMEG